MFENTKMFRTVTSTVQTFNPDKGPDIRLMQQQQQQKAVMESAAAYNKDLLKQVDEEEKQKVLTESFNYGNRMAYLKAQAYNAVEKEIPDLVVSEAFARIYIDALPHDKEFIVENYNGLKNMAKFYIRKLGGAKYLKQRVYESHNPFLSKLYAVCMETAKPIKEKKKAKIAKALTEEEVQEMIVPKVNDEERESIIKNINSLGTDELSELVREKIINVVKDEHQRQKEEQEFRTVLKNDIDDPTLRMNADNSSSVKKKGGSIDTEDDDAISDVEPVEETEPKDSKPSTTPKKPDKKEEDKSTNPPKADDKKDDKKDSATKPLVSGKEEKKDDKETAKESLMHLSMDLKTAMERWDPIRKNFTYSEEATRPQPLFFAICQSVMRDLTMQKMVFEHTEMKVEKKPVSESLLKNPLNLDIFSSYIKHNDNIIDTVVGQEYTEPQVYATTDPGVIDKDRILTESLIQYGLLETAYTMRLIEPTTQQVVEQCLYLSKGQ